MANEKETQLQRQFRERDVQRMRNIITKKYNDTTGIQIGYRKQHIEHNEGDIWSENGKDWIIKDGIKMTISKLDVVKKILQVPFICPDCGRPMKKPKLDKKMWFIHKKCFDCVIEYETKLRQEGKYLEYQKVLINANIDSYIHEMNIAFEDFMLNEMNEKIVTEEGDIEQWSGGKIDKNKIATEFKEYIAHLHELKNK